MRYWLDTEFIEDGRTIDLISIGIVAEDGREYYAVSSEFNESKASPWVKKNVLPHIDMTIAVPRKTIRNQVLLFVGNYHYEHDTGRRKSHEFWAYYGAYDWVALCQLFGPMVDLPDGWPMYARDIKQWCDDLGNPILPSQGKNLHHALADSKWTKTAWEYLRTLADTAKRPVSEAPHRRQS